MKHPHFILSTSLLFKQYFNIFACTPVIVINKNFMKRSMLYPSITAFIIIHNKNEHFVQSETRKREAGEAAQ